MEVFPDSNLLLDELRPLCREFIEIRISDRKVMCTGTDHVKKGSYTVERATDEQNAPLCAELCLAIALRIVCLDDPDTFINETFSRQSHMHERLIELLRDITIGTANETKNFLEISTKESVTGARIT